MTTDYRDTLREIRTFPSLVKFLRDDLDWPIDSTGDFEDITFDYTPAELGIDAASAAKIDEIKQLRRLAANQPWGIFFVKFEPKQLPVVALRRILNALAVKRRAMASDADQKKWATDDLLFISNYGEDEERRISFAHFSQDPSHDRLPTLKVLAWDDLDTPLHLDYTANTLVERLAWPASEDEWDDETWRDRWSSAFELRNREVITTSKNLAVSLAKLARTIRDRLKTVLSIETEDGPVTELMKAFKTALVHDLDADTFADMYAQTIAYGLLTARVTNANANSAVGATVLTPITNPFLKELLEAFLGAGGKPGGINFDELGVSEVVELLDDANMEAVVRDFGDKNPEEDPVIHFYELFLKEYDAKKRMQRGVFYTPRPVVSFIVRSVDELLHQEFGLRDGLADTTTWAEIAARSEIEIPSGVDPAEPFVRILDPACGTGTFLVEAIDLIHDRMIGRWAEEGCDKDELELRWNEYVPKHLLPRLHGYELLMAPYAVAHLKVGLKLYETGYHFASSQRAHIYLTNALEPAQDFSDRLEFAMPALAHEAQAVNRVKRDQRFTAVIGNPPYAGQSSNHGTWIAELLRSRLSDGSSSFFEFDGAPLDEPNVKWLNDDYVKFLRLAQAIVAQSGVGVTGMITNHSWLENPTFRGMRQSIAQTFTRAFVLDLHGNMKKKEVAPDGTKDQNVFDIQQGVAIALLVSRRQPSEVMHADLFGHRLAKYEDLVRRTVLSIGWVALLPRPPLLLWRPFDSTNSSEYESFTPVTDVFSRGDGKGRGSCWAKGLATTKDHLYISFDRAEAESKIGLLASETASDAEVAEALNLPDTPYFTIADARERIRAGNWRSRIHDVTYRPMDTRTLYWHPELYDVGRGASSKRVMSQLLKPNLALVTSRMMIHPGSLGSSVRWRPTLGRCLS